MKRIPYDNIQRQRTRIDDLKDVLPYIALFFIGLAFIIWFERTLKSLLVGVFIDLPLWLWSNFSSASIPMKFFTIGMLISILWYILKRRNEPSHPHYNRRF